MSANDFVDDGAEFDDWENAADDLEDQEKELQEQLRRQAAAEKEKEEKRVQKHTTQTEVKTLKVTSVKVSAASRQVYDNAQVQYQSISSMDTSSKNKITKIDPSELGTFMAEDVVKQLKAAASSKKVVDLYVEGLLTPLLPLLRKQQLDRLSTMAGEVAATVVTSTADALDTVDDAASGPSEFNAETDLM